MGVRGRSDLRELGLPAALPLPLPGMWLEVCSRRARRAEAVGGGAAGIAPVGTPARPPSPMAPRGSAVGEGASSPCLCSHAWRRKGRVSGASTRALPCGHARLCAARCVAARLQLDGRKHLGPSADHLLQLVELGCSAPLLPRRRACRRVAQIAIVLLRLIARDGLALR